MAKQDSHLYVFGAFRLDTAERLLLRLDGVRVHLTEKAFDTLATLVRRRGRLVSKEELMAEVWPNAFVEENNLDKSISVIRQALGEKASAPEYIETVRGRGYRFLARVSEVQEETINSVAVLPLINASTDTAMEYLSDGITESIINSLSQVPKLRVMARGTVFRYKSQEVDPREVGNALGVRVILAGRVLQVGNRVVIRTELVDTANGSQLWGQQYNRKLSDILVVQEEIALEVAEQLRLKLSGGEKKRLAKRYTENTEAYQLYLKGRYFWNKAMAPEMQTALKYFQQAIDIDPGYALAYTGLADCYALLGNFSALPPGDVFPKAKAAVVKALELDEMLAEAHTSLAYIKTIYEWDWITAEKEFKRAIELKSSDEWCHEAYGWYLAAMARFDESIAEMKRAREVAPLSVPAIAHLGVPLFYARRYDEAIEHFQEALEMDPDCGYIRFRLALAYAQEGMYEKASAELQPMRGMSRDRDAVAALGYIYAISNQKDKAQGTLAELNERAKQEYVPSYHMTIIHAGLGETDKAFDWLEKAYEERSYWLTFLRVDPILDKLRSDVRYIDLLQRFELDMS